MDNIERTGGESRRFWICHPFVIWRQRASSSQSHRHKGSARNAPGLIKGRISSLASSFLKCQPQQLIWYQLLVHCTLGTDLVHENVPDALLTVTLTVSFHHQPFVSVQSQPCWPTPAILLQV